MHNVFVLPALQTGSGRDRRPEATQSYSGRATRPPPGEMRQIGTRNHSGVRYRELASPPGVGGGPYLSLALYGRQQRAAVAILKRFTFLGKKNN